MEKNVQLADLLGRCSQGDRKAFRQLYEKTSAQLYGFCLRILREREWADEVLQDAYVSIWNHAGRYTSDMSSPMTWMATIVRNRALDMLRKHKQELLHDDIDDVLLHDELNATPLQNTEQEREALRIEECLRELSEDQRHCVVLAYYKGMSHDELSHFLQTPVGTVKSWIRRGLQKMKGCLE